jgi:hypothetical protein
MTSEIRSLPEDKDFVQADTARIAERISENPLFPKELARLNNAASR